MAWHFVLFLGYYWNECRVAIVIVFAGLRGRLQFFVCFGVEEKRIWEVFRDVF